MRKTTVKFSLISPYSRLDFLEKVYILSCMKKEHKLTRRDILTMEAELCHDIAQVIPFEGHSLYFPTNNEPKQAIWIPEEEKILLPLRRSENNDLLAVFLASKPQIRNPETLLPLLGSLTAVCLEKLAYRRASERDEHTDLVTGSYFYDKLEDEIIQLRASFADSESLLYGTSIGVMSIQLTSLLKLAKKYGHLFAIKSIQKLADALCEILPHDYTIARIAEDEFALLLSTKQTGSGRKELNEIAQNICHILSNTPLSLPQNIQTAEKYTRCAVHVGYILFPQDFDVFAPERNASELAYALMEKARLAAHSATDQGRQYLPFASLLNEGGIIVQTLPLARVALSLGKNAGLREAQRFAVYTDNPDSEFNATPYYKGEIIISEVFEEQALAETVLLYDASLPIEKNDFLIKLPDDNTTATGLNSKPEKDRFTKLYKHGDFLTLFASLRQEYSSFTLALLHIGEALEDDAHIEQLFPMETILAEGVHAINFNFRSLTGIIEQPKQLNLLDNLSLPSEFPILSRYGHNGILMFHPYLLNEQALSVFSDIAAKLTEQTHRKISIGIASHPFLDFHQIDALENCKKALECAKLLAYPHVGCCDSIALTVAADKFSAQGNLFDALQTYQQALLADENNALAWNSLGATFGALGRIAEAQYHFLQALKRTPHDVSILYNLGGLSQKLGDKTEAKHYFEECLRLDPSYFFAHIRLGQLAELENKTDIAKAHYQKAIEIDSTHPTAYRHLAKIEINVQNLSKAREYLHQALRCKDHDSGTLVLLAQLYLDNGEDPQLAEIILNPIMNAAQNNPVAWFTYARALKAQNKTEQANQAELKATASSGVFNKGTAQNPIEDNLAVPYI